MIDIPYFWIPSALECGGKLTIKADKEEYIATMSWATCDDVVIGRSAGTLFGAMAYLEGALQDDAEWEMIKSGGV